MIIMGNRTWYHQYLCNNNCRVRCFKQAKYAQEYTVPNGNRNPILTCLYILSHISPSLSNLQLDSITQHISEANDASRVGALVLDGVSGDVNFPHGNIKPVMTVGEINMCEENHGDVVSKLHSILSQILLRI